MTVFAFFVTGAKGKNLFQHWLAWQKKNQGGIRYFTVKWFWAPKPLIWQKGHQYMFCSSLIQEDFGALTFFLILIFQELRAVEVLKRFLRPPFGQFFGVSFFRFTQIEWVESKNSCLQPVENRVSWFLKVVYRPNSIREI